MFKTLLLEKKITQQSLANAVNKSQRLVSYWANGKCQPQLSDVMKISKFLEISTDNLIKYFVQEPINCESPINEKTL